LTSDTPRKKLHAELPGLLHAARSIQGWLEPEEIEFLALVAAYPTTTGRVVELGSYHGKSTVVLAKALAWNSAEKLVSVDPIDPEPLYRNLEQQQVRNRVEFFNTASSDFWQDWHQPIRILWHDGANATSEVTQDLAAGIQWLSDCALVAFHDVLNLSGERIHVFCDEILGSPHFGASGLCGSIGWSQFHQQVQNAAQHRRANDRLRKQLNRLRPFAKLDAPRLSTQSKCYYKLLRWLVPHAPVDVNQWLLKIDRNISETTAKRRELPRAA
jgi:hypothetical protein